MHGKGFRIAVTPGGGLEIVVGLDTYRIESSFSYPGHPIGRNSLAMQAGPDEGRWRPEVIRKSDTVLQLSANGPHYTLLRRLCMQDDRLTVEDTLANVGVEPVGIIIENVITATGKLQSGPMSGVGQTVTAENPTLFLSQQNSSLGIIARDDILRLQFEAMASPQRALFATRHFALDKSKSYTIRWSAYPLAGNADFFDFVNAIRREYDTNFTVPGPFEFFEAPPAKNPLVDDPVKLKAYVQRKKLKITAMAPWLGYFDGAPLTREQHKATLQNAMAAIRKADPEIQCIACVENNIVSLDRGKIKHSDLFSDVCLESGKYPIALSAEQTRILDEVSPWKDSLVKTIAGRAQIEDCAPKSHIHQMVYSEPGNYQARYLMDQFRFLIEDVGADGIYIDQFNLAFEAKQRYNYAKWDGFTVDIDPQTGRIVRKYMDAGLVGAPVRKALCEYVLSKGKILVANTHAAVEETQSLHVFRFMEAGWNAKDAAWSDGQEPPVLPHLCKGLFDSPIGLGVAPQQMTAADKPQQAEIVMRAVITYLRHGLVYYHYSSDIPETGPGSGEYGPINHMFPITPVRLFKGGIIGKERTVTCVSGRYEWKLPAKPTVRVFGLDGREKKGDFGLNRAEGGWMVDLKLRDWFEIAAIEG